MPRKYRVAVIGAGIAERHLAGFRWLPELFEVPVLCSLDEDRGLRLTSEFAIPEYTQDAAALFDARRHRHRRHLHAARRRISSSASAASRPAST